MFSAGHRIVTEEKVEDRRKERTQQTLVGVKMGGQYKMETRPLKELRKIPYRQ